MNFIKKHRMLIDRRGGMKKHLRLSYVLWKIGREKYVRVTRKQYKKGK